MLYSIDTSSLIEAWRQFPPEFVRTLWEERFPALIRAGDLRATKEVAVELGRHSSELVEWALHNEQSDLFVEVDEEIQVVVTEILDSHPRLIDPETLRSGADPFVIGLARCGSATVVTEERPSRDAANNPKIPDVCDHYDIRCIDVRDLIREENWDW
ncbi:MAG TPA: DUF4411 family protein [Candidatus Dormibacteraeota bacterium]